MCLISLSFSPSLHRCHSLHIFLSYYHSFPHIFSVWLSHYLSLYLSYFSLWPSVSNFYFSFLSLFSFYPPYLSYLSESFCLSLSDSLSYIFHLSRLPLCFLTTFLSSFSFFLSPFFLALSHSNTHSGRSTYNNHTLGTQ